MEKVHILTDSLDFFLFSEKYSLFVTKKGGISKYELREKYIFCQLVANFAIFRRIRAYLCKAIIYLKNIILKESLYFDN